jgi:putative oxidoreductase
MGASEIGRSAVRAVGRGAIAWMFVHASSAVFRDPTRATGTAGPLLARLRKASPVPLPADRDLVRLNAAVQVVTGTLIGANLAVRPAAAVLAGSMVPTTLAGHSYWTVEDPAARRMQRLQFDKNLATVGGLLLLAAGWSRNRDGR